MVSPATFSMECKVGIVVLHTTIYQVLAGITTLMMLLYRVFVR